MEFDERQRTAIAIFIERGFRKEDFTDLVYKSLYGKFEHIAHFDKGGFWWEWFTCDRECPSCTSPIPSHPGRWAERILAWPIERMSENEKWIRRRLEIHYSPVAQAETPETPATAFECKCGEVANEVIAIRSVGDKSVSVRYDCPKCGEMMTIRPMNLKTGGPVLRVTYERP